MHPNAIVLNSFNKFVEYILFKDSFKNYMKFRNNSKNTYFKEHILINNVT